MSDSSHQRVNNILLARPEQAVLNWLARNLPSWISSDFMMVLGFIGAMTTAGGYILTLLHPGFL